MLKKLFQRKGEIVSKMRALLDTATKSNRTCSAHTSQRSRRYRLRSL